MMTLYELQNQMLQKVIGQDQAVKDLTTSVYKYLIKAHARDYGLSLGTATTILLQGDSGTGKTHLVKVLSEIVNIPVYEINAKSISQEGWSGKSFVDLLKDAMRDTTFKSKGGIIFIDEFDKAVTPLYCSGGNDVNHATQSSILKYIEGMKVMISGIDINLQDFMFVFSGAFVGLDMTENQTIGFQPERQQADFKQALLKYGLLPELAGRIQTFTRLRPLEKQDYLNILNNQTSCLAFWKQMMQKLDINLEINVDKLIEDVVKSNLGVRGLIQEIEKIVSEAMEKNIGECDIEKFSPLYTKTTKSDDHDRGNLHEFKLQSRD
jgi:ATP-dependent protease Clp ATPase subunit